MTTPKQVLNYHIKRLGDKNPEARLQAIEELRKIGDLAALEPLQALYQNDDDMAVRRAAQAAGRAIWQNQSQTAGE